METKHLIEHEEILTTSADNLITLTNMRLRYQSGNDHFISMMLEKISAIEINYTSKFWALLLGIIIIIIGGGLTLTQSNDQEVGLIGVFVGVVLIIYYIATRKHVVQISAECGTKIIFFTKGMKRESLLDFINKIEVAKNKRYLTNIK